VGVIVLAIGWYAFRRIRFLRGTLIMQRATRVEKQILHLWLRMTHGKFVLR
jgi:hypothetical protein